MRVFDMSRERMHLRRKPIFHARIMPYIIRFCLYTDCAIKAIRLYSHDRFLVQSSLMFFYRRIIDKIKRESVRLKKGRIEILLYHFVTEEDNPFTVNAHLVRPDVFRAQMQYVSKHYRVISLNQVLEIMSGDGKDGPYVAVCFDDGYLNNITEAYPILEELKVPATIFVSPSIVNNADLLWREKIRYIVATDLIDQCIDFLKSGAHADKYNFELLGRMTFYRWSKEKKAITDMSIQDDLNKFFASRNISAAAIAAQHHLYAKKDDLHERAYLDFGNHTLTHPLMPCLTYKEQEEELHAAHTRLTDLGLTLDAFAAPFAAYNEDTVAICKQLGYHLVLDDGILSNVIDGKKDAFRVLHRKLVPATLAELRAII